MPELARRDSAAFNEKLSILKITPLFYVVNYFNYVISYCEHCGTILNWNDILVGARISGAIRRDKKASDDLRDTFITLITDKGYHVSFATDNDDELYISWKNNVDWKQIELEEFT